MSETLTAAAEKMGVPEALVQRSAEARAKAAGSSTDDILAAWAGGEAAPAAEPPATPPETPEEPETPGEPAAAVSEPAAAETPEPAPGEAPAAPVTTVTRPSTPPVLVGRHDRLVGAVLGALALLALSLLVGFTVASTPAETTGAYTSRYAYSDFALEGREVYRAQGCGACHTQVVRPIVADAGLGGVSVSDSNQVIGTRRIGPDLAHIGSRVETDADLYAVLVDGEGHPPYGGLTQTDLDVLVAYLMESK